MAEGVLMAWDYGSRILLEQDITHHGSGQGAVTYVRASRYVPDQSVSVDWTSGRESHVRGAASLE